MAFYGKEMAFTVYKERMGVDGLRDNELNYSDGVIIFNFLIMLREFDELLEIRKIILGFTTILSRFIWR